jgi:ATP synthase protein I
MAEQQHSTNKSSGGSPSPGSLAGMGLQFVVSILLFLYLGQWLDTKLASAPWFLIIGVFLGASLGFYSMYRSLMAVQAADDAARKAKREGGP